MSFCTFCYGVLDKLVYLRATFLNYRFFLPYSQVKTFKFCDSYACEDNFCSGQNIIFNITWNTQTWVFEAGMWNSLKLFCTFSVQRSSVAVPHFRFSPVKKLDTSVTESSLWELTSLCKMCKQSCVSAKGGRLETSLVGSWWVCHCCSRHVLAIRCRVPS